MIAANVLFRRSTMTISPEELGSLRDSLRGLLGTSKPDVAPTPDPGWKARWPALADLGVLALCASEEVGGFGNEVVAALLVSRELGAALHGSPFAASVAATYAVTRWVQPAERRTELANAILSGAHIPVLALLEPGSSIAGDGELRVNGRARLVPGVDDCDSFLLVAPDRDTMTFVPQTDRCAADSVQTFDVTRSCADVVFRDATALPLRSTAADRDRTERLHGLLLAGDAIGGVELMLDRTTAYALGRKAFGKVIGGFQAVQHRLVDHALWVRGASLVVS
ncbi:MAG: acyl-CoA dehydrogenase family protein, partial [Candidatus Binatia bacterium]